jgi:hypothetical protein
MAGREEKPPAYVSPYKRPQISYADHAVDIEAIVDLIVGVVAAMKLKEPDDVVERWNGRMWEALRALTAEQCVEIIVILAEPAVRARVAVLLAEVG